MGSAGLDAFYPGDKLVVELTFEILFESSLIKQMQEDLDQIEGLYNIYKMIEAALSLTKGIQGFVSGASGALDSIIKANKVTDTLKLKALGELLSALDELYGLFESGDSDALELANNIQSTDFYKQLSSFASQEELEGFFLAQDVTAILSLLDKIQATLKGEAETDDAKPFNAFDSMRTLIGNLPIRYVVDWVRIEKMEGSTTSIPYEIEMVPAGQAPRMGVESWGKYIYSSVIATMGKISAPWHAQLFGASDDLTGYEDAVSYVRQTENQTAAYSVHKDCYTNFSAWVERADGTIATPDHYVVATANESASYSADGKLNFTGNAIVEVTAKAQGVATFSAKKDVLCIRDNDAGTVKKIYIDVVPAHTCSSSGWHVDAAPAAGQDGFRTKYCDTCGDPIAMELLTACGSHDFGQWTVTQEATQDYMGIQSRECRNCGAKETEYLPALSVRGDFTGDSAVDDQDVVYLLWHALFPEMYPITTDGDMDRNGITDAEDAVYLLWHCLFREKYPL